MSKATIKNLPGGKVQVSELLCDHGKDLAGPNGYSNRLGMFCGETECPCLERCKTGEPELEQIVDELFQMFSD